jgi:hypothetical protein
VSIALLLLAVAHNTGNVIAVINPLEKMLAFADAGTSDVANGSSPAAVVLLLLEGLGSVLARYSFVLHSSSRPTVFLTWLIIPGIVLAWRRGEKLAALQSLALMLAAIGIDTRAEGRIFHLHRSADRARGRDPDRCDVRSALSQMDVWNRHDAARPACRRRSGRAVQRQVQAFRPGIDLRVEPALHAAAAAAVVPRIAITAC